MAKKSKKKKRKLTAWQKHVKKTMKDYPGLTFKEALPKAKLTYKPSRVSGRNPAKPKTKKRSGKKTGKKKNRKKPGFTVPLTIVAPIIAIPLVPSRDGWASPMEDAKNGDWKAVGAHLVNGFQPFISIINPRYGYTKFELHVPRYLAMILGGVIAHKIASKLGVNRALGRARIPFIRV